jgi:hypothetical protein
VKKQRTEPKPAGRGDPIASYARSLAPAQRPTFEALRKLIDAALPRATSRVWHGSPVWFLDENPVVGYSANAKGVSLLFWNGQAFDEPGLLPVGKYGAAQAVFAAAGELKPAVVRRWLRKAGADVFDSREFFRKLREQRAREGAGRRPAARKR